jgi:hypothetical protein
MVEAAKATDEHNRVHRDLDWAQIKDGVPAGL